MSVEITNDLGFYFIIFQRTLYPNYLQCWIDGDSDYNFYTSEELIDFAKRSSYPAVTSSLYYAFDETGMFMWDVEAGVVRRLHASTEPSSLLQDLLKMKDLQDNQSQDPFNLIRVSNNDEIKIQL